MNRIILVSLATFLFGLLACQPPSDLPEGKSDFILGDIAYVPFEHELQLIDISDPERPFRLGHLSIGWPIVDVQARGEILFVLRRAESALFDQTVTDGGLMIFDISDPSQPVELAFAPFPPFPTAMGLLEAHVYISDYEKTVVYDISDLRSPTLLPLELNPFSSFYQDGTRWLAGFGSCDLRSGRCFGRFGAIDISDPAAPKVTTNLEGDIPAYAVTVLDNTVYTLGRGLSAMPTDQLQPLENHHTPGFIATYSGLMSAAEPNLYVAEGGGLLVFDVSQPLAPVIIGEERSPPRGTYYRALALRDSTAFAVSQYGLHVIDIGQPSAPRGVAVFDLSR